VTDAPGGEAVIRLPAEPAADPGRMLVDMHPGPEPQPPAGSCPDQARPSPDQAAPDPGPPAEAPTSPDLAGGSVAAQTAVDPAGAVPGPPRDIPHGHLLTNRYRLSGRIAAGGMGEVWRGTDELLGRPVAVKLLSAAHASDERFRERFRAEARYAGSLSHPGIARVYDYGESIAAAGGDDLPMAGGAYLVMELVEGEPLSATLAREGRMTPAATLDIVAQAARALAVAHEAGIAHRDIKPGNLLITRDGQVKITDFGIARAVLAAHLTQSGMVMGTAQYVSPEQASAGPITTATDIYSLGVVAYECLAGRPPFAAETPIALALAHVRDRPPRLPGDVPAPVAALVGQMLAKEPADRPASAQLVADRASALLDTSLSGDGARIIGAAELAGPADWFSDPSPAGPGPGHPGTAPMKRTSDRPPRSRRSGVLALAACAAVAAAAGGIIAIMAAAGHPATASNSVPTAGARAHDTTAPRKASSPPGVAGQTSPAAAPTPSPTGSRQPSPGPSTPPTSSPPPSSPGSTPPSTPPTTPPTTGTTTPPTASPSGGPPSAAPVSPPAANTRT
jgi:eukaryotic-like serine/threonine-protein kinase